MCGITGIIGKNAHEQIYVVPEAISHRGPDDSGVYLGDNIALGHKRLSIIDLTMNGHQPMTTLDGRYTIVFNGEIYNHTEIREAIKEKYTFKSTSDTETLLYGFIEYGTEFFNKLNGIFALAIFDNKTNELVIARDPFGVKPLYYSHSNDSFSFSSEIKALVKVSDFDKTINEHAFANYIYFLWSPGEATPFKNCKKLLPGHYIKINTKKLNDFKIHKYYEIPFNGVYSDKSEEDLINELDEKLTNAVNRQLLSDVPVGYFLSGGLDSSLIVALAKKLYPEKHLKCYTIKTETNSVREGFIEDLPYALKVAKYLDVELEVVPANIDIVRDFDKMIYHLDEPQADSAPLNVANICEIARQQGYIVLLGGTGGDDLFSGYRRHQFLYYNKKMRLIPYFILKLITYLSKILKYNSSLNRRFKKLFSVYKYKDLMTQMSSLFGWLEQDKVKALFVKDVNEFKPDDFLKNSLKNIPDEFSELNQMLYWELKYFLTDHNLNYTDKLSMMHGVEIRVPFLDKELVEFSTTIPPNLKMKGTTTKYLLRKVAERYLPHEIIYRSKSGFGAPVRDWIINDLHEKIEKELLNEDFITNQGIFSYKEIKSLIDKNNNGEIDASYSIWALLAIQSWLKQFANN